MARRLAAILQADVRRAIRAAKKEGAAEVEVQIGQTRIVVRMQSTAQQQPLEQDEEIVL